GGSTQWDVGEGLNRTLGSLAGGIFGVAKGVGAFAYGIFDFVALSIVDAGLGSISSLLNTVGINTDYSPMGSLGKLAFDAASRSDNAFSFLGRFIGGLAEGVFIAPVAQAW